MQLAMENELINAWIEKAKDSAADARASTQGRGVAVVRRKKTRGNVIIEIAEKIRPVLARLFEGARDENGMLVQPAHVRAIALNVAQDIIKEQEQKAA